MVKRVVVGAHYGLRDWLGQRATAAVLVAYTLYMLLLFGLHPPVNFLAWRSLFAHTWVRVPTFVALLCVYFHAWIGMRDIMMDYIKPTVIRLVLQIGVIVVLLTYTAWTVQILWSL